MERERKRINMINNNFVSVNSNNDQVETFNTDIHTEDFSVNFRKEKSVLSKHASQFLPPLNK